MPKCAAEEQMEMVDDILKRWGRYQLTDRRAMGAIAMIYGACKPTPEDIEWAMENATTLRLARMSDYMEGKT